MRDGLSRRAFLARGAQATAALAGIGGLSGLAGCGGSGGAGDLRRLAREVSGPVVVPGDRGYARARLLFNPHFDGARPRAVVFCRTPEDVAATVDFARRAGIRPAARSGGHSFGGYSSPTGGIAVDVSRMNQVQVAPDRASALLGPGVLNIDMYTSLGGRGLALPSGDCPTVGLGGLSLGGGFGYSSRKLGLTTDNLLEVELVLASGERVTASPDRHPDLFWASRGGGGGNFGIVTSLRFRVHPVDEVSVFQLAWDWRDAATVVDAWQRWAPEAPDELFSVCNVKRTGGTPPTSAAITCQGQLFGPSSRLSELLDPLLSAARPTQRKVATLSFLAAQQLWAGCTAGHCAPRAANPYEVKSAFFSDPMPREAITTLLDELEAWPGSAATSPPVGFELNSWGGAMGRVPSSATAFVHRHARVLMIVGATWSARDGAARVAANRAWLRNLYSRVRPYSSGQAYQNLIDPHLDDWKHAYYGSNLPRLIEVKRRYDPDEVFRFAQGIPTG